MNPFARAASILALTCMALIFMTPLASCAAPNPDTRSEEGGTQVSDAAEKQISAGTSELTSSTAQSLEDGIAIAEQEEIKTTSKPEGVVEIDNCEWTFGDFETDQELWFESYDSGDALSAMSDEKGKTYLFSKCSVTNNKKTEYYPSFGMEAQFVFDDEYTYGGEVASSSGAIDPLCSDNVYIYVNAPDEIIDNFETCTITLKAYELTYSPDDDVYYTGDEIAKYEITLAR